MLDLNKAGIWLVHWSPGSTNHAEAVSAGNREAYESFSLTRSMSAPTSLNFSTIRS